MKNVTLYMVIVILLFPCIAFADNGKLEQLLEQINQVENTLARENQELKEKLAQIEKRLTKFSTDIATVQALKEEIDLKYKDIVKHETKMETTQEKITENENELTRVKTLIEKLEKDQTRIEGNIDSSEKIVTWVTLIVSLVVIIVGAFFSKVFLELYSNYRVVCARYPELKPEDHHS